MIVVSDTSPITYLIQVGELSLLQKLFSVVVIPTEVFKELQASPLNDPLLSPAVEEGWIRVQKPFKKADETLLGELDTGEAEAIALALELKADLVIMDERIGTLVARQLNLRVYGLIGVLVEAKQKNLLPAIKPLLDKIIECGFRISLNFYNKILLQVNE